MSAPRDEIAQSGDDCRLRMRSSVRLRSCVASKYPASIHVSAGGRSPLQRLCGGLVCRKETFESKLRERHVNWRGENRRRTYEAKLAGGGDDLEWDEHPRGLVAARRGGAGGWSRWGGEILVRCKGKARGAAAAVRPLWRRPRSRRCARHSVRLAMRGASPLGCRLSRSTLTGGLSSSASSPSSSGATAALADTSCQWRAIARAGNRSCPLNPPSTPPRPATHSRPARGLSP